jgi:hypothetical protein
MDRSAIKDWAEIISKAIPAVAILVTGGWVYYKWDSVFPKQNAEVLSAAADIRTDISGEFTLQVGDGGASSPAFKGEQLDPLELCEQNKSTIILLDTLVAGSLAIKSASKIPVASKFVKLEVQAAQNSPPLLSVAKPSEPTNAVSSLSFRQVGTIGPDAIIGGLAENRVEKDKEIKNSFLLNLKLPFDCSRSDSLVVFRAEYELTAIDPVKNSPMQGATVKKVFVSGCQITMAGDGGCNIERIEAYGQ